MEIHAAKKPGHPHNSQFGYSLADKQWKLQATHMMPFEQMRKASQWNARNEFRVSLK